MDKTYTKPKWFFQIQLFEDGSMQKKVITEDEGPRAGVTAESLSKLKPVPWLILVSGLFYHILSVDRLISEFFFLIYIYILYMCICIYFIDQGDDPGSLAWVLESFEAPNDGNAMGKINGYIQYIYIYIYIMAFM